MTLGFGACPFGSTPMGYGVLPVANSSTASLLKKTLVNGPGGQLIGGDGTQGDCALINVVTGDYVLDAFGNKVGDDSINQMVYLALRTALGSSANQTLGIVFPGGVVTPNLVVQQQQAVQTALANLISQNLIALLRVDVVRRGTSGLQTRIRWQAVSTGQTQEAFI